MDKSASTVANNQNNEIEIDVVFSSCEAYRPIWENFFSLFLSYMPTYRYHFYGTIADDYHYKGITVRGNHYKGKDQSFSTRLIKTLQIIKSDYVLFLLDDFFLTGIVKEEILLKAIKDITNNKRIKNIILKDFIKTKARCSKKYDDVFSVVKRKAPFRCTTQVSLFNRKYLISLLRRGETAWEFEFFGSYRAMIYNKLVLYRNDAFHNYIPYFDAGYLKKGKFNPDYEDFANAHKLPKYDLSIKNEHNTTNKKRTTPIRLFEKTKECIGKIIDYFYPPLSAFFVFLRRGRGHIPYYIKKKNYFMKDDVMK